MLAASCGGALALVGTYWDDAWHTDRGRDSLLVPPHLLLYLGVLTAVVAVLVLARRPWGAAQRLATTGGAAVLLSAPADELWHVRFGRDAVLWSPPHMFAVIASLMLATGVLMLAREAPGSRLGRASTLLAAAAVIGALQVPVLEFDSDVPQFPVWTYLPVAVTGWLLATVILRRLLPNGQSFLAACLVYTALRVGIVVLLAGLDHSGTVVAPVLLLGLLDEVLARNRVPGNARLLVAGPLAALIWFWWLGLVGGAATSVAAGDLGTAVSGAVLGAVGVVAVSGGFRGWSLRPVVGTCAIATAGLVLGVAVAPTAGAHDPGQGAPAQDAILTLNRAGDATIHVDLTIDAASCTQLVPDRSRARRAGTQRVGSLRAAGPCRFRGTVEAGDEGRWFVYVELTLDDRPLELWAPLGRGEETAIVTRPLYAPTERPGAGLQVALGALLYLAMAGMLRVTLRSTMGIAGATD